MIQGSDDVIEESTLSGWINNERFEAFVHVTRSNFHDITTTGKWHTIDSILHNPTLIQYTDCQVCYEYIVIQIFFWVKNSKPAAVWFSFSLEYYLLQVKIKCKNMTGLKILVQGKKIITDNY